MSYNEIHRSAQEACWALEFGHRLKDLLKQKNMTIVQLARLSGVPKSSIESCLKGTTIPNYYRVALIAKTLDISVEKLTDVSSNEDLYDDEYDDDYDED